jgi:hypothetical protein
MVKKYEKEKFIMFQILISMIIIKIYITLNDLFQFESLTTLILSDNFYFIFSSIF